MITLREVRDQIAANPDGWRNYLMDFTMDFRRRKDLRAVAEPFDLSDRRLDALLASTAETLCDEIGSAPPEWLGRVPACDSPFFLIGSEDQKAIAIVESPRTFVSV
jgi:hypothetical protein